MDSRSYLWVPIPLRSTTYIGPEGATYSVRLVGVEDQTIGAWSAPFAIDTDSSGMP